MSDSLPRYGLSSARLLFPWLLTLGEAGSVVDPEDLLESFVFFLLLSVS